MLYYLIFLGVMSLIAAILYAVDKHKAKTQKWRISERTLLIFGFFGGAVGALLAMKLCRHKTKHWYFWVVNLLGLAVQIALGVLIYVKFCK